MRVAGIGMLQSVLEQPLLQFCRNQVVLALLITQRKARRLKQRVTDNRESAHSTWTQRPTESKAVDGIGETWRGFVDLGINLGSDAQAQGSN